MGNSPSYTPEKLRTNLQMAITRIGILKNKRMARNYSLKDEVAGLLRNGQEEMAMIKVEGFINTENHIAALEVVTMYCAQCLERVRQISESRNIPDDMRPAIETLIWSASRTEVPELIEVRAQFAGKYGIDFCKKANSNSDGHVNKNVEKKLVPIVPTEEEKTVKLQEIAAEKRIDYVPKNEVKHNLNNIVPPQGFAPNYQQENLYPRVPTYNPSAAPYQAPGQGYGQGQYQQPPQGQYQPSPQGLYQPSPQGVYQPPQGQYQPPSAGYQSYPLQDPNISQPPYNPSGQNYPTTSPLDFNPRQQPANIPPPNIPKTETRQPPPRPQTPPEPAVHGDDLDSLEARFRKLK